MGHEYIVEMKKISKSFSGVKVLDDVDLSIKPGEVRALAGENGAGKSTLIKILGGILEKDSGQIFINGEKQEIDTVEDARKFGISIIHQEISLVQDLSIAENIFSGREITSKYSQYFIDFNKMNAMAKEVLDSMNINLNPETLVRRLSISQQQLVEISRSLTANAKIIVMDEPTASLTNKEIDYLFEQIEKLKKANVAIIYISHKIEEIFRIADSFTVLRDGKLIATEPVKEMTNDKLIKYMVGRELSKMYDFQKLETGETVLEVKNLTTKDVRNVNFELKKGEILGFSGLVGAGRTELARALFGIDALLGGEILLHGKPLKLSNPQDAIDNGIALVPEDRKNLGLVLINKISFNLTLTVLQKFISFINVNKRKEKKILDDYISRLSIRMASPDQNVQELSGGNQQKVVVSKWLVLEPQILIMDEPTRGIDVGAKAEIYALMHKIAKTGVSIIMISSELLEILNMSTRVAVMHEGTIKKIFDMYEDNVTQEAIMYYATGGK